MKSLIEIYNKNKGKSPLFSQIIDIDYYDGPIEALCRLDDSNQWYICSLVYINFRSNERIFTLLEIDKSMELKFETIIKDRPSNQPDYFDKLKRQVKSVYKNYSGDLFLYKGRSVNDSQYTVVEIPLKNLRYFDNIEMVIEQNEQAQLQWNQFFLC